MHLFQAKAHRNTEMQETQHTNRHTRTDTQTIKRTQKIRLIKADIYVQ